MSFVWGNWQFSCINIHNLCVAGEWGIRVTLTQIIHQNNDLIFNLCADSLAKVYTTTWSCFQFIAVNLLYASTKLFLILKKVMINNKVWLRKNFYTAINLLLGGCLTLPKGSTTNVCIYINKYIHMIIFEKYENK